MQLPKEVRWSFLDQKRRPWLWEYQGNNKTGYYSKQLDKESSDFQKVHDLFYNTWIKGGVLKIDFISAIYNPSLTSSFITQWKVITDRLSQINSPFSSKEGSYREKREFVEKHFEELVHAFSYDDSKGVPILPVCHGTEHCIAEKIAQTGFASLATIDAGFYGRGIYFSTFAQYTFPYVESRDNPTIIIAYIVPGNPYPVIENPREKRNLIGQGMKGGFNSHYVLCDKNGMVIANKEEAKENLFNEFVISQESQIVPAFIIDLDTSNFPEFSRDWKREVVSKRDRFGTKSEQSLDSSLNMNVI